MNKLLFRVRLLMILGMIFTCSLMAQPVLYNWEINQGETIVSTISTGEGLDAYGSSDYFATSSRVYINRSSRGKEKIFQAPPGRTIRQLGRKFIAGENGTLKFGELLVLLDNGEVHILYYAYDVHFAHNRFFSKIVTEGSVTWQKIMGEAIFALSSAGMYVTRDNGATWQTNISGLGGTSIRDFDQDTTGSILYAAANNGLYRQDTLPGAVWSKVNSFTTPSAFRVFIDRKNRILVAGNGTGLWKSTDNGLTWPTFHDGIGTGLNATLDVFTEDVYGHLYGANSTTRRLYRSLHGTQPWERIDAGIVSLSGNAPLIRSLSADTVLTAGTSVGLFISNDQGITWQKADSGIMAENFYGLVKQGNGKIFTSTSLGVFAKNATDTAWNKAYPTIGYSGQVGLHADPSGVLYGVDGNVPHDFSEPNPLVKSTDVGVTWALDTAGYSSLTPGLFYIDETGVQHHANSLQSSGTICKVWKRMPAGQWLIDTVGFPAMVSSSVSSMGSDGNGNLYISGIISGKKVMRRPTAGGTWVVDTAGLGATVNSFAQMIPAGDGAIVGRSGGNIFRKSGAAWLRIPNPAQITNPVSTAMAVDSAGNIFVAYISNGVGKGVFYTNDSGASWTFAGLDSIRVSQLIAYDDTVYALTLGRGAFILTAAAPADPLVCRWLGTKNTDWHDAGNWSCGVVPDSTKNVMIPTATPFACEVINADAVAGRAWIQPGAVISVKNGRKLDVQGTNATSTW